jgi:hypothetical protein
MGNTALRKWQIGVESSEAYGTEVDATRIIYPGAGSILDKEIAFFTPELDMGSYDLGRGGKFQQLIEAGGSLSDMVLDTNMIIELLQMAVSSTPSSGTQIAATGAYTWTFEPGASLSSATLEFDSSGQVFIATGCVVDELSFSWAVNDPVSVSAAIIAKNISKGSLTASLDDFTIRPIQGWEAQLFIGALGTDPFGGTAKSGTLISGEITIANNLQRRYFDDNTQALTRLNRGKRSVEASLVLDLNTTSITEYDNWEAGTEITLGIRLGNNRQAGTNAANKHKVEFTLPGIWTAQSLGDSDDASTIELTLENVYNSTLENSLEIVVVNTRAS